MNRSRQRSPNLSAWDRILAGLLALLMRPTRLLRSAIVLKPSTLLGLHKALSKHKYRLLFSPNPRRKPGPKGPSAEWMRVITNLAANSDIERPEEFGRSLAGIEKLVPYGDQILQRFADPEIEVLGFSPQQVREEVLKARLILSRSGWRVRIHAAEAHGYFEGQIEFLLKFSGVLDRWLSDKSIGWSDSEDAEYQSKFSDCCAKASAVFCATGLNDFGAHRWERALLTKGDYLLQRGINRSFLDNSGRDGSWKRLLRGSFKSDQSVEEKRQYVRDLFDEIDVGTGVKESLDAVLQAVDGGAVAVRRDRTSGSPRLLLGPEYSVASRW